MKAFAIVVIAGPLLFISSRRVIADTFGTGANQFSIEFVTIGNPGNPVDATGAPNPAGSVPYIYRMGKYEISRKMIENANAAGGLGITLHAMDFVAGGARPDMPATGVSWNEAARFTNWLNSSQGFSEAYKFSKQPGEPSRADQKFTMRKGWHAQRLCDGRGIVSDSRFTTPFADSGRATHIG